MTGAVSYFKDRFAGGRTMSKAAASGWTKRPDAVDSYYKDNVVHYVNGSLRARYRGRRRLKCAHDHGNSWSAWHHQRFRDRHLDDRQADPEPGCTLRRYRIYLPEQSVAAGRFVPQAVDYPANDSVKTFSHIVPRFGATYDLAGDGKTVVKASWGRFYFNPGVNLADSVNVNTANQFADHVWNDLNGDRVFQVGEAGTQVQRFGGTAGAALDPNLKNSYGDETSFFVERAVIADLGVRAGFVYKTTAMAGAGQSLASLQQLQHPGHRVDPGVDGVYGNGDDANVSAFN